MKYKMDVKQVLPGLYTVTSERNPNNKYFVDMRDKPVTRCTCPDHIIRGNKKCKHIKLVEISNFEKVVKNELVQLVPEKTG